MSKTMLINVTHAEESRVGIVEDGQLESFEIESLSREHLKGNIYKGIIRRIHPAIEAAFVDIGADRDAFLPLDEICFRNLPAGRNGSSGDKGRRRIKEVLKSGDEVLVQIVKEQFTNKPPTLSTFYSLPGRYLVLLPGSEDAGISRKIEGEERIRVRELIAELNPPPGCGIIVRTAAGFDEQSGELERDLNYLQRLWGSIKKHAETKRAPALVYREHDLVLRTIRDYFTPDINEIFIDNEEVYERAKDFLMNVMPGKEHILKLYQGERPIFSRFGLEAQIESIYKRRVQLKSGGSIVIDGTEALTAIDVNSGGSMRGGSQEETAHKTNLEAATEIARQLRLRDLGGIIVIDFIDMRTPSHINDVERTLREAMRADKARHDIGRISRLGLLEVSRQRLRPSAAASSYTACPMCEGHGAVRTPESAALVTLRKIHHRIAEGDVEQMRVGIPRDVAMYLLNQKRDDLAVLEARYAARIQVVVDDKLMPHQSEIDTRTRDPRELAERPLSIVRPGDIATASAAVEAPANGLTRRAPAARSSSARGVDKPVTGRSGARPPSDAQSEEAKQRRRRRRGGRDRKSSAAGGDATTTPDDVDRDRAPSGDAAFSAAGASRAEAPGETGDGGTRYELGSAPDDTVGDGLSARHEREELTGSEHTSHSEEVSSDVGRWPAADRVDDAVTAPPSDAESSRFDADASRTAPDDDAFRWSARESQRSWRDRDERADETTSSAADPPVHVTSAVSESGTLREETATERDAYLAPVVEQLGAAEPDREHDDERRRSAAWDPRPIDVTRPAAGNADASPQAPTDLHRGFDAAADFADSIDVARVDVEGASDDDEAAPTEIARDGEESPAAPRRRRRRGGRRGGRGRRAQRTAPAGTESSSTADLPASSDDPSALQGAGRLEDPSEHGSRRRHGPAQRADDAPPGGPAEPIDS